MPSRTMLIDASHPEETRVVVVDGHRVEDYDVEVASRRQLKGNIYLAKVTRVEPSLQAAFIDYGGNRHGFLAFNEIHPDYYQIPVADRERLLAEQAAESVERDEAEDVEGETVADDEEEVERRRSRPPSRFYKIQEVIKRRQIMLVQVTKEERGNKGAALTTYLSLAGRYCVLMPNTARGGGISRKIASATDRKRLKKMLSELEAPDGMAVIVRTAGAGRNKAEIKRDYEYLIRLWSSIRETTLVSTAPTLVYEEASLIKRSIRDLYDRDIEEIVVQGGEEYRISRDFMKLFISSHAKRVKLYEDDEVPLFQKYGLEDQLASMHQPIVQLRSGGYIVINPTEALVAIDVNSGRSTRERNIEETALRTNLEAADEIARQLRLRDLAGLIVIDFIDMENSRNQGQVERRIKEAMKNDRARVQLGRISPFGLLELSRQRLRPSLIETSFEVCPACGGNGLRRTTESTALAILRKMEEEGLRRRSSEVAITVSPAVAMYLLNQKRRSLQMIEDRYEMAVIVLEDATLVPPDHRLERLRAYDAKVAEEGAEVEEAGVEAEAAEVAEAAAEREDAAGGRGRRRRPRRRRRDEAEATPEERMQAQEREEADDEAELEGEADADTEAEDLAAAKEAEPFAEEAGDQPNRKRRRRGKRGGRRRARPEAAVDAFATDPDDDGAIPAAAGAGADETGGESDAAARAAMDDDGAPAWRGDEIEEIGGIAAGGDDGLPAETAPAEDLGEPEATAALEGTEPADEAPRPRRRAPRRGRSKRKPEADAEAMEAAASAELTEPAEPVEPAEPATAPGVVIVDFPEAANVIGPDLPSAAAMMTEETVAGPAASAPEAEMRVPSPWSVVEEGVDATIPPFAEASADEPPAPPAAPRISSEAAAEADRDQVHREEEDRRAQEARRTEVIRVGEGGAGGEENPRRGWWQRLLT